jgi:hypothetical protein
MDYIDLDILLKDNEFASSKPWVQTPVLPKKKGWWKSPYKYSVQREFMPLKSQKSLAWDEFVTSGAPSIVFSPGNNAAFLTQRDQHKKDD